MKFNVAYFGNNFNFNLSFYYVYKFAPCTSYNSQKIKHKAEVIEFVYGCRNNQESGKINYS